MPRKRTKTTLRKKKAAGLKLQESSRRQISGVLQVAAGILLFLALREEAGALGNSVKAFLTFFFGAWSMLFPTFLLLAGLLQWLAIGSTFELKRTLGLLLCLLSFLGIMHIGAPLQEIGSRRDELAGAVGFMVSLPLLLFTSRAVGYTVLMSAFVIGIVLAFEPNLAAFLNLFRIASPTARNTRKASVPVAPEEDDLLEAGAREDEPPPLADEEEEEPAEEDSQELNIVRPSFAAENGSPAAFAKKMLQEKAQKAAKKSLAQNDTLEMRDTRYEEWTFPGIDLLEQEHSELTVNDEQLKVQAKRIEDKLAEFDIAVTVRDARPGPTVTQFTLKPAEGVKLSSIGNLKDDLALALAAQSLRIEAPIPGKDLVGIEMPNEKRTTVRLREILESGIFQQSSSSLTLPLGRDVSGEAVVAALDDMPHLLIAGATGSGKSVCMNVFLTALLYQNAPHELKFILIDPKRVELSLFNGIPHLLTPVITEAEKALQALRWAVAEMGRRLHRFSEVGARNIEEYNEKQTEETAMLPRIVVVIDELADLMMRQFRRDTETMIVRIAQMARAVGMHLIIATQRPSVDVITGLIKANIPTRIAFRVVSAVDSRTILDGIGAEYLLGKGDMLYMTASIPKPVRIQGIYVTTKETERVINAVKIAGGGKLTEQIGIAEEDQDGTEEAEAQIAHIDLEADDNGGDDLFFEAVKVVQEAGKASASLLQRRLQVGYARAAKLLDIMERKGLIGPVEGAKPRKVFLEKLSV